MTEKKYILSIDSGSTGIRAFLFNHQKEIVVREYEKTPAIFPEPGAIEHDPQMLWEALLKVVNRIFAHEEFSPKEIAAIGISNQRASFCLWDRETGKPVTNFINWADSRKDINKTCDQMNKNRKMMFIKKIGRFFSHLSKKPIFAVLRMFEFTTQHCSVRLKWVLDYNPEFLSRCENGDLVFGTLDTWFVYNLTGRKQHLTDFSNAVASSLFNPLEFSWNKIFCTTFGIPMNIFPEVLDTNGDFGLTDSTLFDGAEIPIRAVAGDQQAGLFGHGCFDPGDIKISQGSGAFVNMIVGSEAKYSLKGLFPLIAWVLNGESTWLLEGNVQTAGTLIDWLGDGIGISETPKVLNELAAQTKDTEGVIFIPTPSGMQFPYFNPQMRGSILGLSLSTHRRHVARAVFEGIAFRLYDIIEGMEKDTKIPIKSIKVDGGVSKSDILLQILADIANITVKRAAEPDMTSTGVAYIAGLAVGFWKNREELMKLQKGYTEFKPSMDPSKRLAKIARWRRAVNAIMKID
ncbi:MAG: glycerol kinase 5 [Promethearchaeota archaeon]